MDEIWRFEVVYYLSFGCSQQVINAAQKWKFQFLIVKWLAVLIYQGSRSIDSAKILVKWFYEHKITNQIDKFVFVLIVESL